MDFFDYFELVSIVFFYIIFLGRTVQLKARGINPFVLGIGKKGLKSVVELSFFIGLAIWTGELVLHATRSGFHIFPESTYQTLFSVPAVRILGVTLTLAGFALFIWALASFGRSWRVGIDTQNPGGLVTTGAFARSRNPIFVFLDLFIVATFLIYSNYFFLIASVITVCGIHYQILQEEKFLSHLHSDAYREYKRNTRRYV